MPGPTLDALGNSQIDATGASVEIVRAQVSRIVDSALFSTAPSLVRLLEFLVAETLAGRADRLKEFSIGLEVFDRGPSFDPRTDTIVRVQARRLRTRLGEYYAGAGRLDPLTIELPKGHYLVRWHLKARSVGWTTLDLPSSLTPLVGRDEDLARLEDWLLAEGARLVTVTGPGGSGKTRLALELLSRVGGRFRGGIKIVSLGALTEHDAAIAAIAHGLGLRKTEGHDAADALVAYVRRHVQLPTLWLLDTFEHVASAAPLLSAILEACPVATILVTSRTRLRLSLEREYALAPLPLPDEHGTVEQLSASPAVVLFARSAGEGPDGLALSDVSAVAGICRRLDGLPLAIELAAAHIRVLPPAALLARLKQGWDLLPLGPRDRPSRHQTLANTIEWSVRLLSPGARQLFARLSVFGGAFTLEGAEAVGDLRRDLRIGVLEGVTELLDQNLVRRVGAGEDEPRFRMLDTIREFGLRLLADGAERALCERACAAYMLVLAEEGGTCTDREAREQWLGRCDREYDNLHVALTHLVATGDHDWSLRIGSVLYLYWEARERLIEGRTWLESILRMVSADARTSLWAFASLRLSALANQQGDWVAATSCARDAAAVFEELGDLRGLAGALNTLGVQEYMQGRFSTAVDFFARSLDLCRRLGDAVAAGGSLSQLASVAKAQRQFDRATALLAEALACFTDAGSGAEVAAALSLLGDVARERGEVGEARRLYDDSARRYVALGDLWGEAKTCIDRGRLARADEDHVQARRHFVRALELFAQVEHRRGAANVLDELACLASQQQDPIRALTLAGASAGLRASVGAASRPELRSALASALSACRRDLDPRVAKAAWAKGQRLPLPGAIALARRTPRARARATRSSTDRRGGGPPPRGRRGARSGGRVRE